MANAPTRTTARESVDTCAIAVEILNLRTATLEPVKYMNAIFTAVHKLALADPHTVVELASLGCYLAESVEGEVECSTGRISTLLAAGNDRPGVTDGN